MKLADIPLQSLCMGFIMSAAGFVVSSKMYFYKGVVSADLSIFFILYAKGLFELQTKLEHSESAELCRGIYSFFQNLISLF